MPALPNATNASKASGQWVASVAEGIAALIMLGYKSNRKWVTTPGFIAPCSSTARWGYGTVQQVCDRFRELKVFWVTYRVIFLGFSLRWSLGQGQHLLWQLPTQPDTLFPCTTGDGGLGEPIMSSIAHFRAYPKTNFLPVLVWNGYSQNITSVSTKTNEQMLAYWYGNSLKKLLVNAKDDRDQPGDYVDSTAFSFEAALPSLKPCW